MNAFEHLYFSAFHNVLFIFLLLLPPSRMIFIITFCQIQIDHTVIVPFYTTSMENTHNTLWKTAVRSSGMSLGRYLFSTGTTTCVNQELTSVGSNIIWSICWLSLMFLYGAASSANVQFSIAWISVTLFMLLRSCCRAIKGLMEMVILNATALFQDNLNYDFSSLFYILYLSSTVHIVFGSIVASHWHFLSYLLQLFHPNFTHLNSTCIGYS